MRMPPPRSSDPPLTNLSPVLRPGRRRGARACCARGRCRGARAPVVHTERAWFETAAMHGKAPAGVPPRQWLSFVQVLPGAVRIQSEIRAVERFSSAVDPMTTSAVHCWASPSPLPRSKQTGGHLPLLHRLKASWRLQWRLRPRETFAIGAGAPPQRCAFAQASARSAWSPIA